MKSPALEAKRIFLIVAKGQSRQQRIANEVGKHVKNVAFLTASDLPQALFKANNQIPHVVIIDNNIGEGNGTDGKAVCNSFLAHFGRYLMALIWITSAPDDQDFVNQIVTGRMQFCPSVENSPEFAACCTKAMNYVAEDGKAGYALKFLMKGQVLFEQGAQAQSVFILRSGELEAIKIEGENRTVLGKVLPGEFVGEMAHINREVRSATVCATQDSELIEIPIGTLDVVLFSKPAWSKALVSTLSKRLRKQNDVVADVKSKKKAS